MLTVVELPPILVIYLLELNNQELQRSSYEHKNYLLGFFSWLPSQLYLQSLHPHVFSFDSFTLSDCFPSIVVDSYLCFFPLGWAGSSTIS
jgi:hypothetical protein